MAQVQKTEADWQTGLVAPVKDTRVQTEVQHFHRFNVDCRLHLSILRASHFLLEKKNAHLLFLQNYLGCDRD